MRAEKPILLDKHKNVARATFKNGHFWRAF